MTLEEFAKATGWPLDEWMALRYTEVIEILALYDLELDFSFGPQKKGRRKSK